MYTSIWCPMCGCKLQKSTDNLYMCWNSIDVFCDVSYFVDTKKMAI